VLYEDGLLALSLQTGTNALKELMEEDARRECGVTQKGKHCKSRTGYRNGYEAGSVFVGGQQVQILRPRVVGLEGGERPITSYNEARHPEFLTRAALAACVLGVSQRNHAEVMWGMAPLSREAATNGLSRSAVGRRFIAAADQQVKELLARRLDERYLVVWLDGIGEGDYLAVAAVGLTDKGNKRILGLRQGSTEDAVLCREFLEDLQERGLSAERGLLFVIDGGKGLAMSIREVFGRKVAVQRCRCHKKRNILDKLTLPEADRLVVERDLEAAWNSRTDVLGRARLELLARGLEARNQGEAAASLREGLRETITCNRIGVPAKLYTSLTNTNVIESTFSLHEAIAHRVKRWQNGQQLVRWAGVALLRAEESFGTVGDAELLRQLSEALEKYAAPSETASTVARERLPASRVA
jgi:transposase-like protein